MAVVNSIYLNAPLTCNADGMLPRSSRQTRRNAGESIRLSREAPASIANRCIESFKPTKNGSRSSVATNALSKGDEPSFPIAIDDTVELPLFPLPLVLFPGTILPLQIFEYRYRIMMHTLLQSDLRFGIVFSGKGNGTAAAIGCVGQVVRYERLPDDRFFLICRGEERFRVTEIVRRRPYLVGKVKWLEDRPSASTDTSEGPDELADEVATIMRDVIRLSGKMQGKVEEAPEDLRKSAFPTPFSFWVASTFEGAPMEQQALLELEDTTERLKRERETLRSTLNYLTAATAVKDAFSGDKGNEV